VNGLVAEIRARQDQGNEQLEAALRRVRQLRLEERLAELARGAVSS
jgi:hypothetical protein